MVEDCDDWHVLDRLAEDGLVINIIFGLLDQTLLQHPCNLVKGGIDALDLWGGGGRCESWYSWYWMWGKGGRGDWQRRWIITTEIFNW